jgi:hypothetical protein
MSVISALTDPEHTYIPCLLNIAGKFDTQAHLDSLSTQPGNAFPTGNDYLESDALLSIIPFRFGVIVTGCERKDYRSSIYNRHRAGTLTKNLEGPCILTF